MTSSRRQELFRALKFLLFSISAGIIQIASFTLLMEAVKLVEWQSHLISLILSVLWNFTFNRRYTFQSAANIPKAMGLVALFYCAFTPFSTWLVNVLTQQGVNGYIVEAGVMVLNFVLEFFYQRFVVFKNSINTNDLAKKKAAS
ncbi:MAG: GtrA family protein [Clostridiales bacterium]|nr:GtrA family protein [Clostridiales bacterium]